jgi:hypothetical protein
MGGICTLKWAIIISKTEWGRSHTYHIWPISFRDVQFIRVMLLFVNYRNITLLGNPLQIGLPFCLHQSKRQL